jgi:hypothetical protein
LGRDQLRVAEPPKLILVELVVKVPKEQTPVGEGVLITLPLEVLAFLLQEKENERHTKSIKFHKRLNLGQLFLVITH